MSSTTELVTVTESVSDLNGIGKNPAKNSNEKQFKELNLREKLSYIKKVITVEPLVICYVVAAYLCIPALYNLEYEKSCRSNLAYNDSICDVILSGAEHNYTIEDNQIQTLIGNMHSWQLPLQSFMPLILVLFLGSYSDRHKLRKPFLIMPMLGELCAVIGCILCVIFMKQWPLEAQGVLQSVVPSLFGGQTMITMAVFAYIADVSSIEMRTLRIGIVIILLNVSLPITESFSGVLFAKIGYIGILLIGGGIYLGGILYGVFWIKEPKRERSEIDVKGFFVDAFDTKHAMDTFNLLLKKSPGNNRVLIVTVLVIMFIYSVVVTGEESILFLYVRKVFRWTPVEYSYYATINTIVHSIGSAVGVPLFTKILKMSDWLIVLVAFLDKILSNIIFLIANTVTKFYIACVVSIIVTIASIAIRSLGTKVVSENDLGKAQSLYGIFEALGPAISSPIYNSLYIGTLETYVPAYFFLGIILYAFASLIIFWRYFKEKKRSTIAIEPSNGIEIKEKYTLDESTRM